MISIKNAKSYCSENISRIENYKKAISDKNTVWECHHRACKSKKELKDAKLYYNRPAKELIFLKPEQHYAVHFEGKTLNAVNKENKTNSNAVKKRKKKARIKNKNKNKQKKPKHIDTKMWPRTSYLPIYNIVY